MNECFRSLRRNGLPAVLMAVLTASAIGSRPLLPIDETRYIAVAWEMHEGRDFLVSHLNGQTYAHKPPLLFWLINAVWLLTGVSEVAARLVVPAVSLTSVLLTARMARSLWPEPGPQLRSIEACAPLIHCSMMLWMLLSPLTMFDALLTLCSQLALTGLLRLHARDTMTGALLLATGTGLGILCKGPVVLVHVLPAVILAPWWSGGAARNAVIWFRDAVLRTCAKISFTNGLGQGSEAPLTQTRSCLSVPVVLNSISCGKLQPDRHGGQPSSDSDSQNPRSTSGRHDDHEFVKLIFVQVLSILGGLLLAMGWVIPSAMHGGDSYAAELLWGQTAGRMVNSFAHREPVWWYLPVLPLTLLPWPLVRIVHGGLQSPAWDSGVRFCVVCIAGSVVILSGVSGKQVHYLLPLLPTAALLLARSLVLCRPAATTVTLWPIAVATMLCGLLPLIFNVTPSLSGGTLTDVCPTWVSLPLVSCGAVLLLVRTPSVVRAVQAVSTAAVLFLSILVVGLGQNFWGGFHVTQLADHVRALQDQHIPVAWFGHYHGQLHFAGRLHSPLAEVYTGEEVSEWLAQNPDGRLVVREVPSAGPGLPAGLQLDDASPILVEGDPTSSPAAWAWRGRTLRSERTVRIRTGLHFARWQVLQAER